MALSTTLLNIKKRLLLCYPKIITRLSEYKLFLLVGILFILFIPLIYLFLFFKKEYSHSSNILQSLKNIHLSEQSLSMKRGKTQQIPLKSQLINLSPLKTEKTTILALKNYLPEKQRQEIEEFFTKNQLVLEKTSPTIDSTSQGEYYKLKNPILIKAKEAQELIDIIESENNLAFSSFSLCKKNQKDNLLTLDFTINVFNSHD